ncbi:MAG TPA: hypothetical protein VMQ78_01800 [Candidatus Limnocylindria bacterium]|nr:hypothetical protein [Candidatus Limnocylindria bacterium]
MEILAPLTSDSALILLAVAGLTATLLAIAKDTQVRRSLPRADIA